MKPLPCIAGIDGGGTKSRLLLYNDRMEKVGEAFSGATNLCSTDETVVEANLRRLFAQAEAAVGEPLSLRAVALGTAGVSRTDAADILAAMLERITGCTQVTVVGDMLLPIYAYAPDETAIILIAGTGSVCLGRSAEGHIVRSGGWGHLFGDEGGAYWLACRGLDACLRAYDGRAEQTGLTPLLLAHFGCGSPTELVSFLYGQPFDKGAIAGAAVCVWEAAKKGDPTAGAILREAADELLLMVKAAAEAMAPPEAIILSGSVLANNTVIRRILREKLTEQYPNARIIQAGDEAGVDCQNPTDAAWGAVRLAALSVGWA